MASDMFREPSPLDYRPEYQRSLPHFQPAGATLFVTTRLAGSLPAEEVRRLRQELEDAKQEIEAHTPADERPAALYREQRRMFGRFDDTLDVAEYGPTWLQQPEIAHIVMDSLHFLDRRQYDLDHYCIMSNHVHLVFTPLVLAGRQVAVQRIMHSLKRHTAQKANELLERQGRFWNNESYDHVVRDEAELNRIRRYVLNNPVKAGLVDEPEEWPYSWACWW